MSKLPLKPVVTTMQHKYGFQMWLCDRATELNEEEPIIGQ